MPAELIVSDSNTSEIIHSEEGTTQGDVAAMGMYAIGIRPLIDTLHQKVDTNLCKQVWYADDSASAGRICEIETWWDELNNIGPKFGYHPKPSKTVLILKNKEQFAQATQIFKDTGIKISVEGERHLGAVIGSSEFREQYIDQKIDKWIKDVEHLADMAKTEPQLAYTAFTKAICMRWCFTQRTISGIEEKFQPLENSIREKLIPAIVGRSVSDVERRILALPVRFGGLGIQNPAPIEFETSSCMTRNLLLVTWSYTSDGKNFLRRQHE